MQHCTTATKFIATESLSDISKCKEQHLLQKLCGKRVSVPKLLLKDHKDPRPDGSYRSILVIPTDGFMAGFGKMACLGLQNTLGDCNMVHKNCDINQAHMLKKKLESLNP